MNNYTREEKIEYYEAKLRTKRAKLVLAEDEIKFLVDRLAFIKSDEYQDFDSDLSKELKRKREIE